MLNYLNITSKTFTSLKGESLRDAKLYYIREINAGNLTAADLSKSLDINRSTINNWVSRYNHGANINGGNGRIKLISDSNMELLKNDVLNNQEIGECIRRENVDELFQKYINKTSKDLGCIEYRNYSSSFLQKTMKQNELKYRNAQNNTDARLLAERDPLNMISTMVMWDYACKLVNHPNQIINYDSTQFQIGKLLSKTTRVLTTGKKNNDTAYMTNTASYEKGNPYYVKYYCIVTANGTLCQTPVYLIGNSDLKNDDFYAYKIPDLSFSSSDDAFGYICICKSRHGNAAFFHWFNTEVIIPFAQSIQRKIGTGNDPIFICCDGEACQINPYLTKELSDKFKNSNIAIAKLAASTTAVAQPCDIAELFKSCKALLSNTKYIDVDCYCRLEKNVLDIMNMHCKNTNTKLTSDYRHRMSKGIIKCNVVISKAVSKYLINKSFLKSGLNNKNMSPNIEKIIGNFKVRLLPEELTDLQAKIPVLTEKFEEKGLLTDQQLSSNLFVQNSPNHNQIVNHKERNALCRQRCRILIGAKRNIELVDENPNKHQKLENNNSKSIRRPVIQLPQHMKDIYE